MAEQGGEIFSVFEGPGRIWAVAAINGDRRRLQELHCQLGRALGPGDRLIYLGNYLGHGDDPVGVVDELLEFRRRALTLSGAEPWDVVYLRGAHEEMWHRLLQLQFAAEPLTVLEWMYGQGIAATLKAYGGNPEEGRQRATEGVLAMTRWTNELRSAIHRHPGHDQLMSALRRYAVTEPRAVLFVHAGLDPDRPLSEQGDTFWWGSAYFDGIEGEYEGFTRIVRGFDRAHRGLIETAHTLSLDAGAGSDGPLNAVCVGPDGEILDRLAAL